MNKPILVSENFVTVSELKAQATECLRKLADSDRPLVITQNGKPAGVLLSPQAYDALAEQGRFVASIEAGMADADEGRVKPHKEVLQRLKRRAARRPV